ncbi:hypothetical protein J4Q44_G00140130 [Coregonus suidteri]|uniref:Uncharacterized protein n=1 Tax=Coregonus suidteri TaxID=861788 RepID=A0AAN8QUM7_9TELE
MKVSKIQISLVFLTNVFVNLRAKDPTVQELKKRWQGERQELLKFPCILKKDPATNVKGKEAGGYEDEMPLRYSMLFENTIYIETFFFCFVVVYGILHLPIWVTLYEKLHKGKVEPQPTDHMT